VLQAAIPGHASPEPGSGRIEPGECVPPARKPVIPAWRRWPWHRRPPSTVASRSASTARRGPTTRRQNRGQHRQADTSPCPEQAWAIARYLLRHRRQTSWNVACTRRSLGPPRTTGSPARARHGAIAGIVRSPTRNLRQSRLIRPAVGVFKLLAATARRQGKSPPPGSRASDRAA